MNNDIFLKRSYYTRRGLIDAKNNALEVCNILYANKNASPAESCMCYGWECGDGWNPVIEQLSYEIEALNILYRPYGIRCIANQVKEKYGTLRFYYGIEAVPNRFKLAISRALEFVSEYLNKLNYKFKEVIVRPRYTEFVPTKIDKSENIDEVKASYANVSNVKIYQGENGDWWKMTTHEYYQTTKSVPTSKVLIWKIKNWLKVLSYKFSEVSTVTNDQRVIMRAFDNKVDELIRIAEHKCYHTCEFCGGPIGLDEDSPRCETTDGWINYVCQKCKKQLADGKYRDELNKGDTENDG